MAELGQAKSSSATLQSFPTLEFCKKVGGVLVLGRLPRGDCGKEGE